ncbi:transposase [Streptomyces alboflavus]|uniref:transposase n=1 Tax=Streptomyces alboflavus TaxID=67267 RepID=UPI003693046C
MDGETRLPLTLWEGRDAETLSDWLREHPGVEVVCRDGSPAYRQGITAGAPEASQVSDRFHLWQGLSKRVQEIAGAHRGCLPAATLEPEPAAKQLTSADGAAEARYTADTPARRHAKRLFEAAQAVADTGRSYSSMARELGLNRRTVHKYAGASSWQECVRRRYPRRPTPLDPYLGYLRQRWEEGEHNGVVLHQEIVAKGYRGHYQQVKLALQPLRRDLPLEEAHERPTTPREVARWIAIAPDQRPLDVSQRLSRLLSHCPELRRTHELVRDFAHMLGVRDATLLPIWLDHLTNAGLPALAGLAKTLREDEAAVLHGVTSRYSSGMNEGRITDVKLQKRIMGGQAGIPLLRQRVVQIAHLRRRYPEPNPPTPG